MAADRRRWSGLAADVLGSITRLRRATRRGAGRPDELASLTGAQLELVRVLRRRPGIAVAEAASELFLAPNTVSTLVRELTTRGLVVRSSDPGDRRVARLDLSPGVRRRVEAWRDRRGDLLADAVGRLSEAERQRLEAALPVLDRLAAVIEGTAGDAAEAAAGRSR